MKSILKIISFVGLALTILPSILVFKGAIEMKAHFHLMAAGLLLWFVTAPFWMKNKSLEDGE
jgi:hypothetical protein